MIMTMSARFYFSISIITHIIMDHFLMIMIMSNISVFMIMFLAFTLRHERHKRPITMLMIVTSLVGTSPCSVFGK